MLTYSLLLLQYWTCYIVFLLPCLYGLFFCQCFCLLLCFWIIVWTTIKKCTWIYLVFLESFRDKHMHPSRQRLFQGWPCVFQIQNQILQRLLKHGFIVEESGCWIGLPAVQIFHISRTFGTSLNKKCNRPWHRWHRQLPRAQNDWGGHKIIFFCLFVCFLVGSPPSCDHRALLHTYIKDSMNRKLLPTLFQYGDVFPTETEYWIKGGFYFCAPPPFSHSPQTNVWRGSGEIISDS